MAYSLLTHVSAGSSTGNNVTTGSIDTSGANLIVIAVGCGAFVNPATPTDSKTNTWSALTQYNDGAAGFATKFYYCYNPTTDAAHTFTESTSGGEPSIAVLALSGSVASPFDLENGNGGFLIDNPGSITPTVNDCVVVSSFVLTDGETGTLTASGMTVIEQVAGVAAQHITIGLAHVIQTSAGAINPTWSGYVVGSFHAVNIADFKPATAGGLAIPVITRQYRQRWS